MSYLNNNNNQNNNFQNINNNNNNNNYQNKNQNQNNNNINNYNNSNKDFFESKSPNLPSEKNIKLLSKIYNKLIIYIKPLIGIRTKKISLYDLRYYIVEIYSVMYIKFSQFLKQKKEINFCKFIYEYILNKYEKKQLVDQFSMNMLLSIYYYKNEYDDKNFFKFFTENL